MMDLILKNKSDVAYTHLVIHIVYGISRYPNGVPMSMWDKRCERNSGTLNFLTFIKMSKEFKILDVVNDDNPITKKIFEDKTESVYYYCNNLSHNSAITVGPVTSGANVLMSNSIHFPFDTIHGNITFNVYGLHETHFKDGYKGPANNINLNPSGVSSNINLVHIEDTSGKWVDLNVFHLINVTSGYKAMIRLNSGGMLDGGPYGQFLNKKNQLN